eukprot:Awhi_evm1s10966
MDDQVNKRLIFNRKNEDKYIQYFEEKDIEGRTIKINNNQIVSASEQTFLKMKIKKNKMPLSMRKQLVYVPMNDIKRYVDIDPQICDVIEEKNNFCISVYCVNNTHKDVILGGDSISGIIRPIEPERLIHLDDLKKNVKKNNNIKKNEKENKNEKKLPYEYQHAKNLNEEEKQKIEKLLKNNMDVFIQDEDDMGVIKNYKEKIELNDYEPITIKQYPLAKVQEDAYEKIVTDMLKKGQVEYSTSQWNTPCLILPKKKEGQFRLVNDFRQLNLRAKKKSWPIININNTFEKLAGCKYFCSLDIKCAYWQMELDEDSRDMTSFSTPTRKVRYRVLPMGYVNSMFSFNKVISSVLHDIDYVVNFVDDIIFGADNIDQLIERCELIFERLKSIGVKLSGEKANIGVLEVDMLGYTCSKDGVKPNYKRMDVIKDWPRPNNVTEMRSFLEPLSKQTGGKKTDLIVWDDKTIVAFKELKDALKYEALAFPQFNQNKFIIAVDSSSLGCGAVLKQVQKGDDGIDRERTIAYASKLFNSHQRKWCITEKECFGILWSATESFHRYMTNERLQRWSLKLQDYDMKVEHISGEKHCDADAISRLAYLKNMGEISNINAININQLYNNTKYINHIKKIGGQEDIKRVNAISNAGFQKEVIVLEQERDEHIHDLKRYLLVEKKVKIVEEKTDNNGKMTLTKMEEKRKEIAKILSEQYNWSRRKANKFRKITQNLFIDVDNIVRKNGYYDRLVVPRTLKEEIIKGHHDSPDAGHYGINMTQYKIRQKYYWFGMDKDIKD